MDVLFILKFINVCVKSCVWVTDIESGELFSIWPPVMEITGSWVHKCCLLLLFFLDFGLINHAYFIRMCTYHTHTFLLLSGHHKDLSKWCFFLDVCRTLVLTCQTFKQQSEATKTKTKTGDLQNGYKTYNPKPEYINLLGISTNRVRWCKSLKSYRRSKRWVVKYIECCNFWTINAKYINNNLPVNFNDYFVTNKSIHSYGTRSNLETIFLFC